MCVCVWVCVCFGGGGWHKASVLGCLPLAAPMGLPPLLILTLCESERVLVVSTEPLDDLSCLTTPGVGRPGDGLLPVPLTRCIQMHTPSPCGGLPTPALTCVRWGVCQMGSAVPRGGGGCFCSERLPLHGATTPLHSTGAGSHTPPCHGKGDDIGPTPCSGGLHADERFW